MGSVLTKLLNYGGFRGCGCVIELPLEEEKEEEQFGLRCIYFVPREIFSHLGGFLFYSKLGFKN